MTSDMSIYYIIGTNPNEYFDIFRIGSYFTISNSLILNSISNLIYDINDFIIFAFGQKKDYMLSQQTNKLYYQLGNTNNDFYEISSDQFIHFHLFSEIDRLFNVLIGKINNDTSQQILIIMQDHGRLYSFKKYNYVFLLDGLSTITSEKDIFIYDESCYSGSLVELFEKNNDIFKYFQQKNKISDQNITSLYYFSILQNFMYYDFGKYFTFFFGRSF